MSWRISSPKVPCDFAFGLQLNCLAVKTRLSGPNNEEKEL